MTDAWQTDQYHTENGSFTRTQLVTILMTEQERIEAEFIGGKSSREKYIEELADLNEKLGIFGLQFVRQPWRETTGPAKRTL